MNNYEFNSCDEIDNTNMDQKVKDLEAELKRVTHERNTLEELLENEVNGFRARLLNAVRRFREGHRSKKMYVDEDGCIKSDRHEIWLGHGGEALIKDRDDGNVVSVPVEDLLFLVILQCARGGIGLNWIHGIKRSPDRLRALGEFTFVESADSLEIHCADPRPGFQSISSVSANIDIRLLHIWHIYCGSKTICEYNKSIGPCPDWPGDTLVMSGARQVIVPTDILMEKVKSMMLG